MPKYRPLACLIFLTALVSGPAHAMNDTIDVHCSDWLDLPVVRSTHPNRKMTFLRVEPGQFKMDVGGKSTAVRLTHPFKAMSTLVTQSMWVDVMGENPSFLFKNSKDSMLIFKDGKFIKLQPDYPVYSMTWFSAAMFANKVSEENGLPPVYDFSQVKFDYMSDAANGTLRLAMGSGPVLINAPDGDIYKAKGYRLPTVAEQRFLMTNRGHLQEGELEQSSWYRANSGMNLHPVAQLAPQVVDGQKFYDLNGLLSEWGSDLLPNQLIQTVNPVGSLNGIYHATTGGNWASFPDELKSEAIAGKLPNDRYITVGLRLVQSVN